jgi:2-polyprenyl-6-methoxyphenol hydroxylase-like FAD-dependent oxidoreductase
VSETDYDVIVVGGGPSGLVVAAEIARWGARVALLEKRTGGPVTRAGTLLPRPLELFDARGIADRFVARTCEVNPHPFTREHIYAGMHPVSWDSLDSRYAFTLYLAQSETEAILREWNRELGVATLVGYDVTNVEDFGSRIAVEASLANGDKVTLTADWVVGADGARGTVRRSIGIPWEGYDATFTGVATICKMPFPFSGGYLSMTNERGWLLAFPFGEGITRLGFVHHDGKNIPRDEPVTREEVVKFASEILGEPIDIPEITEALRYTNARKTAAQFRKGRVLLVGEAMRYHYPASGVGMNYCIQDAFNLGWKLGAVVAGRAEESLIDTYETERRPVCERLMDSVDAQVSIQFNFSREGQVYLRRFQERLINEPDVTRQLQAELLGLEEPYDLGPDTHASVGTPAPDLDVLTSDGRSVRLYEALREDHFVVLDLGGAAGLDKDLIAKAGATVLTGHAIRRPSSLRNAAVLVIRPDAYIGWASDAVPDTSDVARAVFACLHR